MKLTIDLTEDQLQRYKELESERKERAISMRERMPMFKGNMKKLEKDIIYKEESYHFVLAGIEMNDIRDKVFEKVLASYDEIKQLPETAN